MAAVNRFDNVHLVEGIHVNYAKNLGKILCELCGHFGLHLDLKCHLKC